MNANAGNASRRPHSRYLGLLVPGFFALLLSCGDDSASDAGTDAGADAGPDVGPDVGADAEADVGVDGGGPAALLVFSRTAGFRHDSIAAGLAMIESIAADRGWSTVQTEDPSTFIALLDGVDVTVWLNTSGDVLDDDQQAAFEAWYRAGGGWVGVHAASDTEYDWPWYGDLVGAWFANHPAIQDAQYVRESDVHPAVAHLDARWLRRDEHYNFRRNPRDVGVEVVLTIDESSYDGGDMGDDHPIAWGRDFDGGRTFYTALGHTVESYSEEDFVRHVAGAIDYVLAR